MTSLRLTVALVVLCALGAAPATAPAAEPGPWAIAGVARAPATATAGIAHGAGGARFLAGGTTLLRTDGRMQPELTLRTAIPGELLRDPGFDRVGDPGWDAASGRLVVPLACRAGAPAACGSGGLAVFAPNLDWRVGVTLEAAGAPGGRWAEPSPDGALVWTSAGTDLLGYRTGDLTAANATLTGAPIRPAVRLAGAAPSGTLTGGAFWQGRLYVTADGPGPLRIWSLDVGAASPTARLEVEREVSGVAAGLDAEPARGGVLQWLVGPPPGGAPPTYGAGRPAVLALAPPGDGGLRLRVNRRSLRAGRPARIEAIVSQTLGGVTAPLADATVSVAGASARTGADGRAELRVRTLRPGAITARAVSGELRAAPVALQVLPAIGLPLASPPSATFSAGGAGRRVRANVLIDCSGASGCETPRAGLRPRGCIAPRAGADLRISLLRRPARVVDVQVADEGGGVADSGRAIAQGRSALGWRFPVRGSLPRRGTLTVVAVYPDRTGAVTVLRLRARGC